MKLSTFCVIAAFMIACFTEHVAEYFIVLLIVIAHYADLTNKKDGDKN